jgi:hypothetical protein
MAVRWVERYQIYVLTVGNLAAGASVVDVPLPLDSDAPFVLRGRGGRCQNDPRFFQAGMNGLLTQFRDRDDVYTTDFPVPWYLDVPGNGYGGAWKPVYPNLIYPPQGNILVTMRNTGPGAVNLTNLQLYFVGCKLYPPGTPWRTYPKQCSTLDYVYSYWNLSPLNPQLPGQGALLGVSETRRLIPITIQTDADFVLRSGQAGFYFTVPYPSFYQEVFINLMDWEKKPYMNAPVHIDWIFGGGNQTVVQGTIPPNEWATGPAGDVYPVPNNTQNIAESLPPLTSGIIPGQVPLSGNWHPGLIYPEIYVPANSQFYFDLIRNDAGFTEAYPGPEPTTPQPINLHIAFTGSKVFTR